MHDDMHNHHKNIIKVPKGKTAASVVLASLGTDLLNLMQEKFICRFKMTDTSYRRPMNKVNIDSGKWECSRDKVKEVFKDMSAASVVLTSLTQRLNKEDPCERFQILVDLKDHHHLPLSNFKPQLDVSRA